MRTHAKYLFRTLLKRRRVFCKSTHHCPYKNERTLQPYSHANVELNGSPMYKALVVSDNHVTFLLDPLNKEAVKSMGVSTFKEYIKLQMLSYLQCTGTATTLFSWTGFLSIWDTPTTTTIPPPPPPQKKKKKKKIAWNSRKCVCHCIHFRKTCIRIESVKTTSI